jgi:hypothetical protein
MEEPEVQLKEDLAAYWETLTQEEKAKKKWSDPDSLYTYLCQSISNAE